MSLHAPRNVESEMLVDPSNASNPITFLYPRSSLKSNVDNSLYSRKRQRVNKTKSYNVLMPRLVRFRESYLNSLIGMCGAKCQPSFGFGKWKETPCFMVVNAIVVAGFAIARVATFLVTTFPLFTPFPFLAFCYKSFFISGISITR